MADPAAIPVVTATLVVTPSASLLQLGRMEDKTAAKLIAGAAGIAEAVVWVVCEGGGGWFDKSDERRLMAFAWDGVIEKENVMFDSWIDKMSANEAVSRPQNQRSRLNLITETLKEFRQTQMRMRVESFSPSAEESMVGLVVIMCDDYGLFEHLGEIDRQDDLNPAMQHDDKIRRLSRMLRRIPVTRNQFCRTAGCILQYKLCLQEGSAVTTRRLNQIQSDMIRSKANFLRYCEAHHDEIMQIMAKYYNNTGHMYVFDWCSYALQKIDSEQFTTQPENDHMAKKKVWKEGEGSFYADD
jgi:hypothetical protein